MKPFVEGTDRVRARCFLRCWMTMWARITRCGRSTSSSMGWNLAKLGLHRDQSEHARRRHQPQRATATPRRRGNLDGAGEVHCGGLRSRVLLRGTKFLDEITGHRAPLVKPGAGSVAYRISGHPMDALGPRGHPLHRRPSRECGAVRSHARRFRRSWRRAPPPGWQTRPRLATVKTLVEARAALLVVERGINRGRWSKEDAG